MSMAQWRLSQRTLTVRVLVLVSVALLATGAFTPLLTTERLYFFSNTFSLASGLGQLIEKHEYLIATIIAFFCLCVPVAKAVVIWIAAPGPAIGRSSGPAAGLPWLSLADRVGKWSMLEVFVAALLIVALKLGPVADATLHYGAWFLAGSVLVSGVASQLLVHEPRAAPLLANPVTLTLGAIGGAVAATLLIGLLNPGALHLDTLIGTAEQRCVQQTLSRERIYAARSATESEYASRLRELEIADCPEAFREAFAEYVDARERLASFGGAEQTAAPSLFARAGAWIGLVATREDRLEDVADAWAEIERVALEYGISTPPK